MRSTPLFNCLFASLMTCSASAQVAYVYASQGGGTGNIVAFSASAKGRLTPLKGSPFRAAGALVGTNSKFILALDSRNLYAYEVTPDGGVGKLVSQINTRLYQGAECGVPAAAEFDHTGSYVYVSVGPTYEEVQNHHNPCNAYQTFAINSEGTLSFKGATTFLHHQGVYEDSPYIHNNLPKGTGDGKHAFSMFVPNTQGSYYPQIQSFSRETSGTLNWQPSNETDPVSPTKYPYTPTGAFTDDPTNHLAIALTQAGSPIGNGLLVQLGSYTVGPQGQLTSTNTSENMPKVPNYAYCMKLDPTGKYLAVCTPPGVQFFHFNGAKPITPFTGIIGKSGYIADIGWDDHGHLYALNYASNRMHVYTVTATGVKESPDSPTNIGAVPLPIIVRSVRSN